MRSWVTIMIATLSAGLAGCGGPHPSGGKSASLMLGEGSGNVVKAIEVLEFTVGKQYALEPGHVVRLPDVVDGGCTWKVLAGANPGGLSGIVVYNGCGATGPDFQVANGWVYVVTTCSGATTRAAGTWGRARTGRVSGTTQGSYYVVQQEGLEPLDENRVIRMIGPSGDVTAQLLSSPSSGNLIDPESYFEVTDSPSTLPPPTPPANASPKVTQLIAHIKNAAQAVGFP